MEYFSWLVVKHLQGLFNAWGFSICPALLADVPSGFGPPPEGRRG